MGYGRALLVGLVGCLSAAGCSWTDSGSNEEPAPRPAAIRIAYTKIRSGDTTEIWVSRVDGSAKRRVVAGNAPELSPDGRWVVFKRGFGGMGDLMIVPASGGRPRRLADAVVDAVWAPDSKRVAAVQNLDERTSALISIEVETGESTTLARGSIGDVSFSPHGDQIAYADGDLFLDVDICVADTDGGGRQCLTNDGTSAYPVWGPRDIAFARIVPYRGWGAHEIWLMRPDGTRSRLLTKTPPALLGQGITGLAPIAWSGGGRALLAALTNEFGGIPFAVSPTSGAVRRIGDYGYSSWPEGLSRDGAFVLVSQSEVANVTDLTRIEVVPYSGGSARVIARRAAQASWNR